MDSKLLNGLSNLFFARAHTYKRQAAFAAASALLISSMAFVTAQATQQTFQTAQRNVSNRDLGICLSAVDFMGRSHDDRAVSALCQAFASEKRMEVRRAICDALGLLHSAAGRETLITALKDPEPQVRQSAVVALELAGGREGQEALIDQAAKEKDFGVKAHLIQVMGRSGHPKAKAALRTLAKDYDKAISDMAQNELDKRDKSEKK